MTAPRKGSRGTYHPPNRPAIGFTVSSTDGNLCWAVYDGNPEPAIFIWRHPDGLNAMHDWPGKAGPIAACPGYVRSGTNA